MPGDLFMERRIRSLIRWNALAMVMRANKSGDDLGGHIATYQSAATLYEVGFNYFWKGLIIRRDKICSTFKGTRAPASMRDLS